MIHDPGFYETKITNSVAAFVAQVGMKERLSYMWLVCPMTSCTPWWWYDICWDLSHTCSKIWYSGPV